MESNSTTLEISWILWLFCFLDTNFEVCCATLISTAWDPAHYTRTCSLQCPCYWIIFSTLPDPCVDLCLDSHKDTDCDIIICGNFSYNPGILHVPALFEWLSILFFHFSLSSWEYILNQTVTAYIFAMIVPITTTYQISYVQLPTLIMLRGYLIPLINTTFIELNPAANLSLSFYPRVFPRLNLLFQQQECRQNMSWLSLSTNAHDSRYL